MSTLSGDVRRELPLTLTAGDSQRFMRSSRGAAHAPANRAGFPCVRLGKAFRIPRGAFLRLLEAQTAGE
jgi:hypothetical protein